MNQTESLINRIVRSQLHNLNIAIPAIVVNVQDLKDGFIDVKPVVNYVHEITRESYEQSIIRRVRVVFPSTKNSTICFPVKQGDQVELIFQSVNIQSFVNGNAEPHNPLFKSFDNRSDVIAKVGFETYQNSCFNPNNYKNDFNNQDLNIVHNKNSPNEVVFKLTENGEIRMISPNTVHVEAPSVVVDSKEVDAKNSLVRTENDVFIKGKSVYQHMILHKHPYTDDGKPMTTSPPNPL
jgi:hypothetical protein